MKKITVFILSILWLSTSLFAQTTAEELDYELNTWPYNRIRIDYMSNLTLTDSVKRNFLMALSGKLPPRLQDREFRLESWQEAAFLEQSKQKCGDDSVCVEVTYREIIADVLEKKKQYYMKEGISRDLVLAAGSWNVVEAIPILENALENERYGQLAVKMALAKFGNDSLLQELMEKYTLSSAIRAGELDTLNNYALIYPYGLNKTWPIEEGLNVAMYLKNRQMLLNILDLIFITGKIEQNIGGEYFFEPFPQYFLRSLYFYFGWTLHLPASDELYEIMNEYGDAIRELEHKGRSKKNRGELDRLLSAKYRTVLKKRVMDWIDKNVNFE